MEPFVPADFPFWEEEGGGETCLWENDMGVVRCGPPPTDFNMGLSKGMTCVVCDLIFFIYKLLLNFNAMDFFTRMKLLMDLKKFV